MGKKAKTSNLSHIVDKYIQREAAEEAGDEDDEDEGFVEDGFDGGSDMEEVDDEVDITIQSEEEGDFFEAGLAAAEHHRRAQEQADHFVQKAQRGYLQTGDEDVTLGLEARKKVDERRSLQSPEEWEAITTKFKSQLEYCTDSQADPALTPIDDPLWRVRVKPKSEQEVVYFIMQDMVERLASSRDDLPGVKSAFARPAIRGFVYVEAPCYNDVRLVCERAHGYRGDIQLVSIDDAEAALTLKLSDFDVRKESWVRLARGTYKGDLSFLQNLQSPHHDDKHKNAKAAVTLKVIPRIRYFDESVPLISLKRKRDARPTAALFDPVRWQNGVDKVKAARALDGLKDSTQIKLPKLRKLQGAEAAGDVWKLHGNIFKNGLQEMEVPINALNFRPTTPSSSELRLWIQCPDPIVQNLVKRYLRSRNQFWIGDRIRVTQGEYLGRQGTIRSVDEEEVLVFLHSWTKAGGQAFAAEEATIAIANVQKIFLEGDFVEVIEDGVASKTGWVVNVDGEKITISPQAALPDIFSVPNLLHLRAPPFQNTVLQSAPLLAEQTGQFGYALQRMWQGMAVTVVGERTYKGSRGYIRTVQESFKSIYHECASDCRTCIFRLAKNTGHICKVDCQGCLAWKSRDGIVHHCTDDCAGCRSVQLTHVCRANCFGCSTERLVNNKQAFAELTGLKVTVALDGQFGRIVTMDIEYVIPAPEIMSKSAFILACWTKDHYGLPKVPRPDSVQWPSTTDRRRWQDACMTLIAYHQSFEHRAFATRCKVVQHDPNRDALVRSDNKFGLNPPWYTGLLCQDPDGDIDPEGAYKCADNQKLCPPLDNTATRAWAPPLPVLSSEPPPERCGTPRPEMSSSTSVPSSPAWNPSSLAPGEVRNSPSWSFEEDHYHVPDNWYDETLRSLDVVIMLAMASGSRARDRNGVRAYEEKIENRQARLKGTVQAGDMVDVTLLGPDSPSKLSGIHICHLLPKHPDTFANRTLPVIFIGGPLKGEVRFVTKIEGDRVWVKKYDTAKCRDTTEHSKYELALIMYPKRGKGTRRK